MKNLSKITIVIVMMTVLLAAFVSAATFPTPVGASVDAVYLDDVSARITFTGYDSESMPVWLELYNEETNDVLNRIECISPGVFIVPTHIKKVDKKNDKVFYNLIGDCFNVQNSNLEYHFINENTGDHVQMHGLINIKPDCKRCGWKFKLNCIRQVRMVKVVAENEQQPQAKEYAAEPVPASEPGVVQSAPVAPAPAPVYVAPRPAAPRPAVAPALEITAGKSRQGRYFPVAGINGRPIRHEVTGDKGGPLRHEVTGKNGDPVEARVKVSGDTTNADPILLDSNVIGKVRIDNEYMPWLIGGIYLLAFVLLIFVIVYGMKNRK